MRSSKIILFILIILLAIPPFFYGGNDFFIRGMVFVLAGLAGLLFSVAGKNNVKVAEDLNHPTSPFRKGDKNPLNPVRLNAHDEAPLQGGNSAPLVRGGEGGVWGVVYSQGPLIFLFLFLLFSLISVFLSVSPYHSAVFWLESLSYAVLFLVAAKLAIEKREIDLLIKIFLAVSGLLCLIGIYFYLVGSYSRLTSLFWWPNPFAGFLLFALFLGIDWLINCHFDPAFAGEKSLKGDIPTFKGFLTALGMTIPLLFLSLILSSFILTGSRGAFLSFLIVLPVYFYLKYGYSKKIKMSLRVPPRDEAISARHANRDCFVAPPLANGGTPRNDSCRKIGRECFVYFLSVIFFSFFLVFFINFLKNDSFSFISHIKTSGTQSDFSSSIRLKYWQGAWEMFKDRPLTGWGAGTFGTVYHLYQKDPISSGKYAHNWYLEMLSEQGIFTTIFFVLFLILVLFKFFKPPYIPLYKGDKHTSPNPSLVRRGSFALPLFAGILAFLIHNGVDIDWHFGANAIVFWIFLGLLYNVNRLSDYFPLLLSREEREGGVAQPHFTPKPHPIPLLRKERGDILVRRGNIILFIIPAILIFAGAILFHGDYFYEKGVNLKNDGNLAEAEVTFKKSVFLNSDPDYLRELGIIKYSRALNTGGAAGVELLNQALEISKKIIKYDSYNSLNYELAGRVYLARGDSGEAEKNFRKAVELNKFNPRHYINLASLLISENRKEEAKDLINKILFYYPEEVVSNKKMYIMPNQEITSGIEKDIEYLRYLLN